MSETTAKPGRPRDRLADASILAAARDLIAEGGLGNLTVEATAQRAGVAKTTVYRRYPTKLDLAVAAVAAIIGHRPDSDDLEGLARVGMGRFLESFGTPEAQAAYLSVAAAAAANPEVHERFARDVIDPVRQQVAEIVELSRDRGEATESASVDFIFDALIGALIHRFVIRQLPPDPQFMEQFTATMRFLYMGCPQNGA